MEELECVSCDAIFTVDHDLDDDYYKVQHCPFCGSKIVEDEDTVIWDDADWDE
jgi:DNA-directed RNA polymerase subunit RPC12/RpoP